MLSSDFEVYLCGTGGLLFQIPEGLWVQHCHDVKASPGADFVKSPVPTWAHLCVRNGNAKDTRRISRNLYGFPNLSVPLFANIEAAL